MPLCRLKPTSAHSSSGSHHRHKLCQFLCPHQKMGKMLQIALLQVILAALGRNVVPGITNPGFSVPLPGFRLASRATEHQVPKILYNSHSQLAQPNHLLFYYTAVSETTKQVGAARSQKKGEHFPVFPSQLFWQGLHIIYL